MLNDVSAGICTICEGIEDCTYPRGFAPVYNCAELKTVEYGTTQKHPRTEKRQAKKVESEMGLCGSCAKALDCQFVKSNAPVWFCDEYF